MNEYQNFIYNMSMDIINIFEKHNINYFICSGTLLGAVRHKGFIPWDDDMDIMIPIKDYKRALKMLSKELDKDKYFVQNLRTEKHFNLLWSAVRANNTTSMPKSSMKQDIHYGIPVDIFPVIGVNNNKVFRKLQFMLLGLQRTFASVEYSKVADVEIIGKYRYICKIPNWLRRLLIRIMNPFTMQDIKNKKMCTAVDSGFSSVWYPSYVFKERQKFQFEDTELFGSKYYDEYLKIVYGDYMTPPPESERCGHEGDLGKIIKDISKDYTFYKNKEVAN